MAMNKLIESLKTAGVDIRVETTNGYTYVIIPSTTTNIEFTLCFKDGKYWYSH